MPSAREEIAKLQSDLEYSAFLNKGVLQTNAEYKIRIAELEAENKALRRSERQLSKIEDEMENAQVLLKEWEVAGEQWKKEAKALRRELKEESKSKRQLEVENESWARKLDKLTAVLDVVRGSVIKFCEDAECIKTGSQSQAPAVSSTAGPSRPKRLLSPSPPPALPSTSAKRTKRVRSSSPEDETPSPAMPSARASAISTPRLTKRRVDDPGSARIDGSPKASTSRSKAHSSASRSAKKDLVSNASRVRPSVQHHRSNEDIRMQVKDEPHSPNSDDDDPLAMSEVDP